MWRRNRQTLMAICTSVFDATYLSWPHNVAILSCGLGLVVMPGEGCEEAPAVLVVIDHYVFAGCQCLRVKILNSDTIGGRFVSGVDSKLVR